MWSPCVSGPPPVEDSSYSISCNFVDCIANRERGCDRKFQTMRLASEYGTRHGSCPCAHDHALAHAYALALAHGQNVLTQAHAE